MEDPTWTYDEIKTLISEQLGEEEIQRLSVELPTTISPKRGDIPTPVHLFKFDAGGHVNVFVEWNNGTQNNYKEYVGYIEKDTGFYRSGECIS